MSKLLRARALLLAGTFALAASTVAPAADVKVVRIGLASNFTEASPTNLNPYGDYFRKGVTLALEHSRERLAAAGLAIQTVEFDYGTSQVRVLEAARKASDSDVAAVLGYNYSSHALLAAPLHQAKKLPMVTPSATANRIAAFGPYVHMGSFSNAWMGTQLARVATERFKAKKVVLLPASDCAYCTDLANAFRAAIEAKGGTVVAQVDVLEAQTDFTEVLQTLKGKDFDLVLVPNQEVTSARLIYALLNAGHDKPFLGGDGWGNEGEAFFKILGEKPFQGYSATHWHPDLNEPRSRRFVEDYANRFKVQPNDSSVLAYDSTLLLVDAVLNAKDKDRAGVEAALRELTRFEGVTGRFEFDAQSGAPRKRLVLLKAKGKRFVVDSVVDP